VHTFSGSRRFRPRSSLPHALDGDPAQGGVAGILVQGSNGEAQHLSHAERAHAIRLTRQVLDQHGFEKTVIIAGTGAQTTRETRLLNEEAHKAGAAFALVLTPSTWFAKMTPATILRFHREVHELLALRMGPS
jgi:4-hydroxy-2-oxoglutarate aldolase